MISISKTIADPVNGNVILQELDGTDIASQEARTTRTALLDGGSYINNSGFSHGDRTFTIQAELSLVQDRKLKNMLQTWQQVTVSTYEGVFLGTLSGIAVVSGGKASITILIKDKL